MGSIFRSAQQPREHSLQQISSGRPMTPRELSEVLAQQAGTVGIVFGREGTGLNDHELSLCDAIVTIPASVAYQTLNLSHAAAIMFYELFNSESKNAEEGLATEHVRDTILRYLSDSMTTAGVEDYKIGADKQGGEKCAGQICNRNTRGKPSSRTTAQDLKCVARVSHIR